MITFPKVRFDGILGGELFHSILRNPYFVPNKTITKTGEELETPGSGMILVADGFALAAIPVSHDPLDVQGSIPNDVLKSAAKKGTPKENVQVDATLEDSVTWGEGITEEREKGRFPNVICLVKGTQWGETTVTLDIDILMGLAEALCERERHNRKANRYLRLTVVAPTRPVLVEPLDSTDDRWGIIMPMQDKR